MQMEACHKQVSSHNIWLPTKSQVTVVRVTAQIKHKSSCMKSVDQLQFPHLHQASINVLLYLQNDETCWAADISNQQEIYTKCEHTNDNRTNRI